ncbi:ABC transporter substrate-binding protein [Roseomonas terrae]|jgi:4,5-dihydroxyphthalate decarboxylase|uniref:ABC transporter substrate-binding protein n=1 Tax=Neoroseomonas terrae TaxID=424799 RepID=A0ABS5ELP6_9PROT|nr:ABC transporter substrate-binding protein [Neoroseomonas terrae]MBR0651958.1 ABC transporter substrate-binding protein [Neoroseomonas terrae]
MSPRVLTAAIGEYPHTASLPETAALRLDRKTIKPINMAFAPMVRELRFDVCEMAIATFLMAKEAGIPITLLPVVMAERYQEGALVCPRDSPITGPADLKGKRVGVRAYSQTTGMWLRGVLADSYGVKPDSIAWTTFEDAHVPTFRDPSFVTRSAPGRDIATMVRGGELDAAIFGFEVPEGMRTVFPDPAAAGRDFHARYGFKPVNHLVVARSELARDPAIVAGLLDIFGESLTTREALAPAIALAGRFCAEQGLIAKPLTPEQVWA